MAFAGSRFLNHVFPTTFMFGYPFLRPCEYKQGIVRKMIFRQASATRNSVIIIVIVVVPRFDQIIYMSLAKNNVFLAKKNVLLAKKNVLLAKNKGPL